MATILVIDDDPDVLATTRMTFECAGHEVVSTTDPRAAEQLSERTSPDAIVMDVMMPEVDGWELLARFRERPETRWVPVLMLSALDDTTSRVRGLRGGADDYLAKPFEPAELAARVERLVSRQRQEMSGFEGRLDVCALSELAQTLEQNERSGLLEIRSPYGTGSMELDGGLVSAASFEGLEGAEAVRTMLELGEGYFRFRSVETGSGRSNGHGSRLSVRSLALEDAWLRDELHRRAAHVPAPGVPLALSAHPPDLDEEDLSDTVGWVRGYLGRHPGTTVERLVGERAASPGRVRLAVAQLTEKGVVEVATGGRRPGEPDDILDRALRDLFQDSVLRGLTLGGVRVVHFVEPAAWDDIVKLLERLPATLLGEDGAAARDLLTATGRGEMALHHRSGELIFDFAPPPEPTAEVVLPVDTTGVVLWLGGGAPTATLEALARKLDGRSSYGVQRLVVASSEEVRRRALELVGNRLAWRVALDPVTALEDVVWGLVTSAGSEEPAM